MGPTHNNQNSPGDPEKGGSLKITTPVQENDEEIIVTFSDSSADLNL